MYHNFSYLCTNEHIINFKNKTLMNKLLRYSFVALLAVMGFGNVMADEVTLKYEGSTTGNLKADGSNEAASLGLDENTWSVVADKGAASNAPGLNKAGDFRLYWNADGGNTITVKSLTNATISSIAITFTGDTYSNVSVTVNGNAVTGTDGVYNINSTSFVLGNANTTNTQVRISQIVITYTGGTPISVLPPKFSVESGMYFGAQTVALTCETEGAKILYTIPAGEDPVYTDDENVTGVWYDGTPLTIERTTTIKAMAVKDGKTSSIVTATYTIVNVAHAGTEADPFTVADAQTLINALANGATTSEKYFVKGVVVGTPDIQKKDDGTFYGNANFDISDKGGSDKLTCYRLNGLNNAAIDSEDYIKEGDEVVVTGQLQKYVKDEVVTPEVKNGYIFSITPGPKDVTIAPESGDISEALEEALAGAEAKSVTINLKAGAAYTITKAITSSGNVVINGNGATIDAAEFTATAIVQMAASAETPTVITKIDNISFSDLTVKGLTKALFYSSQKNYDIAQFNITDCVIELAADATTIDFTKGSAARNINVLNSTIYAPTATTKSFYSSQSGQKVTEFDAEAIQTFTFKGNTMYNLAKAKNFFTHRQNNQKWLAYDVENNIFVNCGKNGQAIKGMNGGQGGANPIWTIKGNAFNFDGADTSATESTGDEAEPVQDSVAGTIAFTDADNGDFSGTFTLAESATKPEALGDARWTIEFKETPTAISTAKVAETQNGVIYNVAGQKVNASYKGLMIMNGRKFMNK